MRMMMRNLLGYALMVSLFGCAGLSRGCSSFGAQNFGADWVVAQYRFDGTAFNCWKLSNVAITNESASDGIFWKDTRTGHLVHISGWYNRVQVTGGNYDEAAKLTGVDIAKCDNGKYTP
jgi:hypothetical protein